ncbi:MAG: PEP-CTERM sorting domain-containing protein [Methylophilaceae bacterium]
MKLQTRILTAGLALVAASVFSNQASAAEPTLPSILNAIDNSGWSLTSFSALSSADWNKKGSNLLFQLASENTSWAKWQTFAIADGKSNKLVFTGSDTNNDAIVYKLKTALTSYRFDELNPFANFANDQSKIFVSSSGKYAFAHEDWTDNDYNDMVISLSVLPVISPIPEPSVFMLMLVGFAGIGFAVRRKNTA